MTDTFTFQGWPEDAQRFFIGIQLDNSRAYFEAHRDTYERCVRGPMAALLVSLEPEFGPGRIFRINRDIRFSADKSPYKTNIAAIVGSEGRGGYVSLSATGLFAGSGWHVLERDQLARYRAAVADDATGGELDALVSRLRGAGYDVHGEALKVVPRGYERDHPRADLLRHRGITCGRSYGLEPWLGTPKARDRVAEVWRAAQPLLAWLHANVGASGELE
jgi:uncharacterized protein (TIGR02453 family)